jgi:hypothetical protein
MGSKIEILIAMTSGLLDKHFYHPHAPRNHHAHHHHHHHHDRQFGRSPHHNHHHDKVVISGNHDHIRVDRSSGGLEEATFIHSDQSSLQENKVNHT